MADFPRTMVGGVSLSRLIIGTNWFFGWSHTTAPKDAYIKENIGQRNKVVEILETYLRRGVDTVMGQIQHGCMAEAVKEAQQRVGKKMYVVSTPGFKVGPETLTEGWDEGEVRKVLEEQKKLGATFCMPHQYVTDQLLDRCTRKIRRMAELSKMIREYGMIPGLSTHMPESVIYSDESNLDVETYIQIYNSMGFLMQVEVDWIANVIKNAKKPVMTIKPFAAGQVRPFQGLTFVWNTIREQDMVTVGTMSSKEAEEVMDMSLGILEGRPTEVKLQETRSKSSIKTQK